MSSRNSGSSALSWHFWSFWSADVLSNIGVALSAFAIQLIVLNELGGGDVELGLIRGVNTMPLLLFGIVAGMVADSFERVKVLLVTALVSAVCVGVLAALVAGNQATIVWVAACMFLLGVSSTFQSAAQQAFIPDLVEDGQLHLANRWLSKGAQTAAIVGALCAGFGFSLFPSSVLLAVNTVTFLGVACVSMLLLKVRPGSRTIQHLEPESMTPLRAVGFARWLYSYQPLSQYAWSLHLWFVGNGVCVTLFIVYAVATVEVSPGVAGMALAVGGASGVFGAHVSGRLEQLLGTRRALRMAWVVTGLGFLLLGFPAGQQTATVLLFCCQTLFGFGTGMKLPIEMTYRNRVTPPGMRGRMHSYIRTANWGIYAFSAGAAGLLANAFGIRSVLIAGAVAMVLAGILVGRARLQAVA